MINFLEGTLEYSVDNLVVVNVGGVGYGVNVAPGLAQGAMGRHVRLFTHLSVKEDGLTLFGFASREELEMFGILIGVVGVGPKAAQSLLSSMGPSEIATAIVSEDVAALSRAPGIGKKTASRIALELRERVGKLAPGSPGLQLGLSEVGGREEALEALEALGYLRNEALKAVTQSYAKGMTTQDIVRAALRKLAR